MMQAMIDPLTRFYTLVASIDGTVLEPVIRIVENPQTDNPYNQFKAALLEKYSVSREQELDELLRASMKENALPSERLARMRQIAGPAQAETEVFRRLWWTSLPGTIRQVLAPLQKNTLESLAAAADAIIKERATEGPSLSSFYARAPRPRVRFVDVLPHPRSRSRRRPSKARRNSPAPSTSQPRRTTYVVKIGPRPPDWCWYHREFGLDSTKCIATSNGLGRMKDIIKLQPKKKK